ncbi:MAG: hypothetical protein KF893_23890 [Caldilineaceae bacterium]|nr:hypothetical protein [Caldilineaceae bacterium]
MGDRQQLEPRWPRRSTKAEVPLRHDNQDEIQAQQPAARAPYNGSQSRGAETIFDFYLPNVSNQEIADLHRRAEYLLDEMEMGAADRAALESDLDSPRMRSAPNGGHESRWQPPHPAPDAEQEPAPVTPSIASSTEARSRILPETVLPSIRNRPQPAEQQQRPFEPRPLGRESGLPLGARHPETTQTAAATPQKSVLDTPVSRRPEPISTRIDTAPVSISTAEAQRLSEEIDHLYAQVNRLQEARRDLTGHALSLLREARSILLNQPERMGRADYNLRQVRTLLQRAQESRRRSIRTGILLLLYLSFWLMICAASITALILYGETLRLILADGIQRGTFSTHTLPLLLTILAGASGGVIGAIASLVSQLRQGQEFDRQYGVRYTIQPVMGVVLALAIYFLSNFLFNAAGMNLTGSVITAAFPAIIALPAGLWQEMVYAMLYRFTGIFRLSRRR